jgi:hypothetical protein
MPQPLDEPPASAFFASPDGVCVYIAIGQRAVRVEFTSLEAEGSVADADKDALAALAVARAAFAKCRSDLVPLFTLVEHERRPTS